MTSAGWDGIIGQDKAVALLQRASERPVHAYLLVGPRGSGVEEAARCFAAALVAPGDDERAWDLARRGIHPDVVEIDPPANQIRVEDAHTIVDEVYRSPIEGARKAIVVFDAERMNEPAASKLLKTLEEPPPTAVLVLVTAGADQLLPTIRSRCQRVDFAFLGADAVTASLAANGVAPERAALLARLAGGRLDRARAIDGRLAVVRDAFVETAETIDGSGASVALRAEAVQSALHEALADLEAAQAVETERLAAEFTAAGYPERTQRAQLRRLEDRHKRQHRYARTEAMIEGITALETMYRDALVGADTEQLNADRPRLVIDPRGAVAAIEACRAARHALVEHNPAEQLLLERLFLHLAPSGHVTPSLRGR
jgi:DNA polymerase-3 subunit delta'